MSEEITEDEKCTHEIIGWGVCAGCGEVIDWDDAPRQPVIITGCGNRGWYHDGSEEEAALREGRDVRPCPYH